MIISRTPYRISFFGGGTDHPTWYNDNESLIISTTINKYSYINLRKFPPFGSKYTFGGRSIGFMHHRWIFNNTSKNTIEAYAKWSGISSTESLYEKIIKKIASLPIIKMKYLSIITRLGVREDGNYKWVEPELVDYRNSELSFIWVNDFNFNYFNNDFAGPGDPHTIRLFNNFVSTEPVDKDNNLETTFETIEKIILNKD